MNDNQPRDITAALVHGGFLGPWIWADTAAAGPHKAVRHLAFLAAAIPDVGDSLTSFAEASSPANPAPQDESGGEGGEGEGGKGEGGDGGEVDP